MDGNEGRGSLLQRVPSEISKALVNPLKHEFLKHSKRICVRNTNVIPFVLYFSIYSGKPSQ